MVINVLIVICYDYFITLLAERYYVFYLQHHDLMHGDYDLFGKGRPGDRDKGEARRKNQKNCLLESNLEKLQLKMPSRNLKKGPDERVGSHE